jgi:hypothetical protein
MNGMTGLSGTWSRPLLMVIRASCVIRVSYPREETIERSC